MKRRRVRLMQVCVLFLLLLLSTVMLAHAQTGGGPSTLLPSTPLGTGGTGYDLTWSTIDGGGYMFSTGGGYSLGGTVGQPDAGVFASAGGGYSLAGGFWGGAAVQYNIYLPVVIKG